MDPALQAQLNALMRPRVVCTCRRVPESDLRDAVRDGAETFEEVQARTTCSTGCGTCERSVRRIIGEELEALGKSGENSGDGR